MSAGLKFMASEIEQAALKYSNVVLVKVAPRRNPITGQHVELTVQPAEGGAIDKADLLAFLEGRLQAHQVPRRITVENVGVGHRFKRI
jgi:long-chain acyl-CoA synthetase